MTIDQNSFDSNIGACQTGNNAAGDQAAADLSRQAWGAPANGPVALDKSQNIVFTDQQGRVTEVDHPDGEIYNYDNFQPNGQPGQVRITDSKSGDWGQWKREEDGLWRAYHKDKPDYEVVRGEWLVDDKGMMHMQGVQGTKELPPVITKDADGHITKVSRDDGVTYQYSKFDQNGQPEVCKITDKKSHDWGYWKKEGDHLWRSYDKEKPNYEVLRGDWTVDKNGVMQMNGVQDSLPKPAPAHHEHSHKSRAENFKIGPGPDGVPHFSPEGYRPLKGPVSPEVVAEAKSLLHGDYGTETPFEINGKRYMARVEPHYHPPGYVGGPNGWHKGVTVYEARQ